MDWKLSAAVGGIIGSMLTSTLTVNTDALQRETLQEIQTLRSDIYAVSEPCVEKRTVYEFSMHSLKLPETSGDLTLHGCTFMTAFSDAEKKAGAEWLKSIVEGEVPK